MQDDNTIINKEKLWDLIINDLIGTLPTVAIEMALKPLGLKSFDGKTLTLITPNTYWSKTVKNKYTVEISRALKKYSRNPDADFNICVDKNYKPKNLTTQKTASNRTQETITQTQLPLNEVQIDSLKVLTSYGINVKYNFENFVVAKSNKIAFASAKAIVNEPGKLYNPLFIWGGAGLGKTHLVNAIGKEILTKQPDLKLKYITINDFTNEFTRIMYEYKGNPHKKNEFVNKYRNIDILLIDDVQFLEGKEKTQDEIFSIFDYLHRNAKQIVLTSDRQPKDIPTLTDRLRTRFEWGMIAEIKPPANETRMEILKLKAKENNITLPDEVMQMIANAFNTNVRELEGALNRLSGYMSIEPDEKMTTELASEILGLDKITKKLTINDIIEIVAEYYKIEPSEIKGTAKTKEIVTPRNIVVYLTRELLNMSYTQIGNTLGNRKHATVMYAYDQIKNHKDTDFNLGKELKYLIDKIKLAFLYQI